MDWVMLVTFLLQLFDGCQEDKGAEEVAAAALLDVGPFRLSMAVRRGLKAQGLRGRRLNSTTRDALDKLLLDIATAGDDELLAAAQDSIGASQETDED